MTMLLARTFLALTGWRAEGARPEGNHFVVIAAPHTSNWDLAYLLAFAKVLGIRVSWMGKHTLFRGPMGWAMRALGGVPVRRDVQLNTVDQMAREFARRPELALTVPAEGTRGWRDHWKSGFYHIARKADVPIVLSYLDYARRIGGFGPCFKPTGDIKRDMDEIRRFYADKTGKYPDLFSEIRLLEEG